MERAPRAVDEAADAVFVGLARLVAAHDREPSRRRGRAVEVETTCREHFAHVHLPLLGDQLRRAGVELGQQRTERGQLAGAHEVGLADDQHVGELDLLDQQVIDGAVVILVQREVAVPELVALAEVLREGRRVDDRDHGVQLGEVPEPFALLVDERERLGHRHRLRDPRRLDQQVVEPAAAGQLGDLFQQVFAQRAADAAVLHLHELLLGAVQRGAAVSDQRSVDVHRAHVVDDHRDPQALAVVEDVLEQRRLAGSQETGQDRHRQALAVHRGGIEHRDLLNTG